MKNNYTAGQVRLFLREKNVNVDLEYIHLGLWYYILSKDKRPPNYKISFGVEGRADDNNCHVQFCDRSWNLPGVFEPNKHKMLENYLNEQVRAVKWSILDGTCEGVRGIYIRAERPSSSGDRAKIARHLITVLPKLFPDQIQLTQSKIELIKKLDSIIKHWNDGSSQEILDFGVTQIQSEFEEFVTRDNREHLKECLKASHENRIFRYRDKLQQASEDAEHYMEAYMKAINEYNEYNDILEGLMKNEVSEDYNALENMLFHNDSISDVSFSDGSVFYRIDVPLKVYDKVAYNNRLHFNDSEAESLNSAILRGIEGDEEKKYWLKMLDEIFLEEKYYIKSANYFKLHIDGRSQLTVINNRTITGEVMPHPHGQVFGCTGTFSQEWNAALIDQNIPAAIQYTIAYTSHLNWNDFSVCHRMVNDLRWSFYGRKILVDNNGKAFTPKEVVERIKNEAIPSED